MGYGKLGVIEDIRVFLHPRRDYTCLRRGEKRVGGRRDGGGGDTCKVVPSKMKFESLVHLVLPVFFYVP